MDPPNESVRPDTVVPSDGSSQQPNTNGDGQIASVDAVPSPHSQPPIASEPSSQLLNLLVNRKRKIIDSDGSEGDVGSVVYEAKRVQGSRKRANVADASTRSDPAQVNNSAWPCHSTTSLSKTSAADHPTTRDFSNVRVKILGRGNEKSKEMGWHTLHTENNQHGMDAAIKADPFTVNIIADGPKVQRQTLTRRFRDFSVLSEVIRGGIKKMMTQAGGTIHESAGENGEGKGRDKQQDQFAKAVPIRVVPENWSITSNDVAETSFWYDILKIIDGSEERPFRPLAKVPRVIRDPLDGMSIDRWWKAK
ncbi:uncharacterized protein AB675_7675 [Cyphellophora attinorum]|uniref:Uncharacterized protein n=1 Tax=Cyphellophora attinorum TaxID=1664694 RepID=A0A0N1HQR6_9EURO|nr:uncharacterized protein AB675_7675 [Phialophora attinorum]KPI40385.1 hypothetical protein AB675_7675 [Phialophora attinorum]